MNNLYDEMAGIIDESNGGSGGNGGLPPEDSTSYTTPYLPTGFSKVSGTSLSTGLVIQDSTGNQYVWVEVPKTAEVYPTAGLAITNFTDDECTVIENDLHTYTSVYRNNTSYTDTWHADNDSNTSTNNNTNWLSETSYNVAKKNMLKSVYQNGGFYVGRYETGIEVEASGASATNRKSNPVITQIPTEIPVIKANAYPYNWVTRTQAQSLAKNMEHGNKTSSLMFGVQWDLVLKYLETKNAATQLELNTNSTKIGNYIINYWDITNTSAKYSTDYGVSWLTCPYKKNSVKAILLTTGADTSFEKMNIYDIAGNAWEWTLEYTSDPSKPCALRGGFYNNDGSTTPASCRNSDMTTSNYAGPGFRVSLY